MALLEKLFGAGIKGVVDATGKALDGIITNEEERLQARKEVADIIMTRLNEIASYQRDVLNTELMGSTLQRNWRPLVMLCFAFIIVYHYFLQPVLGIWLDIPAIDLPDRFWSLLEIGLGGYVIGRSVEKVASSVSGSLENLPGRRKKSNSQ